MGLSQSIINSEPSLKNKIVPSLNTIIGETPITTIAINPNSNSEAVEEKAVEAVEEKAVEEKAVEAVEAVEEKAVEAVSENKSEVFERYVEQPGIKVLVAPADVSTTDDVIKKYKNKKNKNKNKNSKND